MDNIEQMQHFTRGLRGQNRFLIDATTGGTIRNKNEDEVKKLVDNMCQTEYHTNDKAPTKKGMIELDTPTTLLA